MTNKILSNHVLLFCFLDFYPSTFFTAVVSQRFSFFSICLVQCISKAKKKTTHEEIEFHNSIRDRAFIAIYQLQKSAWKNACFQATAAINIIEKNAQHDLTLILIIFQNVFV